MLGLPKEELLEVETNAFAVSASLVHLTILRRRFVFRVGARWAGY